jgi:AcrR family transcriptional regulator
MSDRYHHGALAAAMVDEALREVRERGGEDVSLRRIATTLGVSPSAAYNHFSDKDALLQAVGQCGHDDLDGRMARAVAGYPEDSDDAAIARFGALGQAYLRFAIEEPQLFRLTFGPLCFAVDGHVDECGGPYGRLCAALDELQARGLLRTRENLDVLTWSTVHGMAVLMLEGAIPVDAGPMLLQAIADLTLTSAARDVPSPE